VIVCVVLAASVGVYVTEQVPPLSVQLVAGLNEPLPELEKLTVPPGVCEVPPLVSVTVAVQLLDFAAATDEGVQLTDVLELRLLTVRENVLLPLLWTVLPP
jgi:hypothetical protein